MSAAAGGRVLIDGLPGETRAAVLAGEDGADLVDLLILRDDRPRLAGARFLGRVAALDRGLAAAFVELGLERPGLLPFRNCPVRLSEGDPVAVRVTREPAPGKGPKLTAKDVPPPEPDAGRPPVCLDPAAPLAELLRRHDPAAVVVEGAERRRALAAALPELAGRIAGHTGPQLLFAGAGLETAIDALLDPEVALPGGGRLTIEPTRTLTAIDVDSGRADAGGGAGRQALETDLAAAAEIARQVRLRALSGLIVVDFLELATKAERQQLAAALAAAFEGDPAGSAVSPVRASGLVELTRRRAELPLHEVLAERAGRAGWIADPVTAAFDLLRRAEREALANPGRQPVLQAAPEVLAAFDGPARPAFDALARRLGAAPERRSDPACPREASEILLT